MSKFTSRGHKEVAWITYNKVHNVVDQYIEVLIKNKKKISEQDLIDIFNALKEHRDSKNYSGLLNMPLVDFLNQVIFNFKISDLPISLRNILQEILDLEIYSNQYNEHTLKFLTKKINDYIHSEEEKVIVPIYFTGNDRFTDFANKLLESQSQKDSLIWFQLMELATKSKGSQPNQKFLNLTSELISKLGAENARTVIHEWLLFVINLKEITITKTEVYNDREYTYDVVEFMDGTNTDALKAVVWMSPFFQDDKTIKIISSLAERCYKSIPEKGVTAGGLGNACLWALNSIGSLDSISQLSNLKLKIKHNSATKIIEQYLSDAGGKINMSTFEIEEISVPDLSIQANKVSTDFDLYSGVIEITSPGKSTLKWYHNDKGFLKSLPKAVSEKFNAEIKALKETQKAIETNTAIQRDRLDRLLRYDRSMTLDYFKQRYLEHGLLSSVIKNVIYCFSNGETTKIAINYNDRWVDVENVEVNINDYLSVKLWHPALSPTLLVRNWRKFLMDNQILQPFKQAFREVYFLTDAERSTRIYSNRMASHILKQHQYSKLAKVRNWKSSLITCWDDGKDHDVANLYFEHCKIRATFWVNALNREGEYNETGIWNYVTTDQIRFIDNETRNEVELEDVPIIILSETMRDIDLFVGVASVGNDPTWNDSGALQVHRNYWESYSFGTLSEIAKTRKEILEKLVPRLKIANVTEISDKFLVVKGKIRTYKIHIGSTNILMEPNDQYLCIVKHNVKNESDNVYLPFDGDQGLSIIISKAFLLANDDKITDTTILTQINRK